MMKKNLILGSFILFFCTGAGAQQLSNSDFEQGWEDCYPLTGYETENKTAVGLQPSGWRAANVAQLTETAELVTKVEDNGNTYVRMENKYVGAMGIGANAPGYLTLGKPWAYAKAKIDFIHGSTIEEADGGTYGGVEFKYRPDAISFKYMSSHGTENSTENFTVSAYSWKGTFTSEEKIGVVFSTPTPVTMSNRDRVVLGEKDAQTSGILVSSATACFNDNADTWQDKTIELNYQNDEIPEYFNIIFSSADYYGERSNIGAGNVLCIDDVKLIYYSDLKSLSYDGTPINIDNPENIQIAAKDFDLSKVSCTSGKGADIQTSYDEGTRILTITIKGNDFSVNSGNHHEYSVKIVPPASEVTGTYNRWITVNMPTPISESANDIEITDEKDGEVSFGLNEFYLGTGSQNMGPIVVPNAKLSYAVDGSINIVAEDQMVAVPGLGGTEMPITLTATMSADKKLVATLNIPWVSVTVNVGEVPFVTSEENGILKVTGEIATASGAAYVKGESKANVIDLTGATLAKDLNSSNFSAEANNTLYKISGDQTLDGNNVIKDGVCDNFVLTDGQSFNAPEDFTASQITYNRVIAPSTDKDEVYTFVLPFALTADQVNGTVYDLTDVKDGVLDFKSVANLEANHPYLVVSNGTELLNNENGELSGKISATNDLTHEISGGVAMVGAYETTSVKSEGNESWYGYNAKGEFVKATSGTINPFRAAIKSTGIAPSSYALKLDGTVTGILNLENPNAKVDVYTISGVCVRKNVPAASALNGLSRGVYIVGGQKVVK